MELPYFDPTHDILSRNPVAHLAAEQILGELLRLATPAGPTKTDPLGRFEVDPIGWTKKRRFLDGERADEGGGGEAALHSGLASALGSHPCVALSS